MGRRKSVVPPVPPQSTEEKRRTRSFAPFRRGNSSRSFQDLDETGEELSLNISRDERPTSSVSHDRRHELPTPTETRAETAPTSIPNGVTPVQAPLESNTEGTSIQPALLDTVDSPQVQVPPAHTSPIHPPSSPRAESAVHVQHEPSSPSVGADESSRNFKIRDEPIQEDESEAQIAMRNMANQLRTQAQSSGLNRVQGSTRGRRDVRNTMYVPSQTEASGTSPSAPRAGPPISISEDSGASENVLASPIQRPLATGILHEDHGVGSDTTSIRSSHSLVAPSHHVDLHEPGLNASVVETVHSWFSETGITKSFVLGEVAFAYNSPSTSDTHHEIVRLQHFERLDKIAANPIFITQTKAPDQPLAEEQAGSYTVSTQPIRRPTPMIGLKYQLHIEESNLAQYSPVLVTPAWQIVEGQVSVIVLYSLNPIFGNELLTLKNVAISVNLNTSGDGAGKATSAMMAPTQGAIFRRKASAVVWRFNDLTVKPEQERLLVRFLTQGGMPKKGTIELKFEIPGRTASGLGVEKLVSGGDKDTTDPFADDTGDSSARGSADEKRWEVVPTKLKLVSGRYTAS